MKSDDLNWSNKNLQNHKYVSLKKEKLGIKFLKKKDPHSPYAIGQFLVFAGAKFQKKETWVKTQKKKTS